MENYELLQIAAEEYHDILGRKPNSSFGLVKKLIKGAIQDERDVKKRKESMIHALQNLFKVKEGAIAGCKSKDVREVVEYVFGIRNENVKGLKTRIKELSAEDLFRYFCYMERISRSPFETRDLLLAESKKKKAVRKALIEEKEQREKEERQRKFDEMTMEQRMEFDIYNGKDMDMLYYQKMADFGAEKKKVTAELLRNYWSSQGKWTGKNVSKKQKEKIAVIKRILEEGM
jgi:hypothetical protein